MIVLSLVGIIYGGLTTCRQSDMKRLIAYSSVSHMGFVTLAIFIQPTLMGMESSILIMFAHGLVSPALFVVAGILYGRFGTRTIKYFKGLSSVMPLLAIITFILILASCGFPLSLNFIGELYLFISVAASSSVSFPILLIILSLGPLIGIVYSLYFYNRLFFGQTTFSLHNIRDLTKKEAITLVLFTLPVFVLGILPSLFSLLLHSSLLNLVSQQYLA